MEGGGGSVTEAQLHQKLKNELQILLLSSSHLFHLCVPQTLSAVIMFLREPYGIARKREVNMCHLCTNKLNFFLSRQSSNKKKKDPNL